MNIKVRKKSGALENWHSEKIVNAIKRSADRIATELSDVDISEVIRLVEERIEDYAKDNIVNVSMVHSLVESALEKVRSDVATSYKDYRNWVKRNAKMMENVTAECNAIQFLGDKSNANAN